MDRIRLGENDCARRDFLAAFAALTGSALFVLPMRSRAEPASAGPADRGRKMYLDAGEVEQLRGLDNYDRAWELWKRKVAPTIK
jgi:hypothetical protein